MSCPVFTHLQRMANLRQQGLTEQTSQELAMIAQTFNTLQRQMAKMRQAQMHQLQQQQQQQQQQQPPGPPPPGYQGMMINGMSPPQHGGMSMPMPMQQMQMPMPMPPSSSMQQGRE